MVFKRFRHKQNRKFFRDIKTVYATNYFEFCISCGDIFKVEKEYIEEPVCENCFGKRISDCAKCHSEFLVREEDKIWQEYCLNCVYEW
jgi:hypothetical protein